jgi:hypothetical protein
MVKRNLPLKRHAVLSLQGGLNSYFVFTNQAVREDNLDEHSREMKVIIASWRLRLQFRCQRARHFAFELHNEKEAGRPGKPSANRLAANENGARQDAMQGSFRTASWDG